MVAGANEDNFHCGMMIDEEGASVGQMVGKFPHVEGGRLLFEEFGHFADLIAVQEGDIYSTGRENELRDISRKEGWLQAYCTLVH